MQTNKKYNYQWEYLYDNPKPKENLKNWNSGFGPKVLQRDEKGKATKVQFRLLLDNCELEVYLIGEFNNWGEDKEKLGKYKLEHDKHSIFANIILDNIKHKDEYKFLVKNEKGELLYLEDPAGVFFTDFGNTVFWDYEDPQTYKQKHNFIDTFHRPTKILQTDLPGLICHFANKDGICGKDMKEKEYFNFIATSGVIQKIKELGFNTIQFLPFAQNIDGDNWKYRYLVPFQFAIQKNWGNPDDFALMIDMFHKEGIAVIGDFVLGHLPHKDFQIFGQSYKEHGIHLWRKPKSRGYENLLYLKEETTWGTMRIDFDNSYVRNFFISSCIHFMKYYKVDGFRIDNVDGIIRFGPNGDGDERENGRVFLRELNQTIYDYNPCALIHYEAHYYYEDNAKMLVAPIDSDKRALGATAYNSSRLTYYFHTKYMFLASEEFSVWKFKHIAEEKEWGKSNSTVADFHNHDAAAGLMEMRCTGAYAYNCMMEGAPSNHIHALGKIKVMEALISFITEGRTLDLVQTFLLQGGTFEHNSSIEWYMTYNEVSHNLLEFKKKINEIMEDPAFWPIFAENREFLNVDDTNKVIVVERSSNYNGKKSNYVIIINTSAWKHHNYKVGLKSKKNYEVILNSDSFAYCGFGMINYNKTLKNCESRSFELLDREVQLDILAPYGIVVLKEVE